MWIARNVGGAPVSFSLALEAPSLALGVVSIHDDSLGC